MNTKRLLDSGSIILAGLGAIALCVGIHMTAKSKRYITKVNKAIDTQKQNLFEKSWIRIVPGLAIGALGIGSAAIGYVNTRRENADLYDKAELMLNEAAADYEINIKENK